MGTLENGIPGLNDSEGPVKKATTGRDAIRASGRKPAQRMMFVGPVHHGPGTSHSQVSIPAIDVADYVGPAVTCALGFSLIIDRIVKGPPDFMSLHRSARK